MAGEKGPSSHIRPATIQLTSARDRATTAKFGNNRGCYSVTAGTRGNLPSFRVPSKRGRRRANVQDRNHKTTRWPWHPYGSCLLSERHGKYLCGRGNYGAAKRLQRHR